MYVHGMEKLLYSNYNGHTHILLQNTVFYQMEGMDTTAWHKFLQNKTLTNWH